MYIFVWAWPTPSLPGDGLGGDVHFDEDEDWSFNTTGVEGKNIFLN